MDTDYVSELLSYIDYSPKKSLGNLPKDIYLIKKQYLEARRIKLFEAFAKYNKITLFLLEKIREKIKRNHTETFDELLLYIIKILNKDAAYSGQTTQYVNNLIKLKVTDELYYSTILTLNNI